MKALQENTQNESQSLRRETENDKNLRLFWQIFDPIKKYVTLRAWNCEKQTFYTTDPLTADQAVI